jgi:hypothetical protein
VHTAKAGKVRGIRKPPSQDTSRGVNESPLVKSDHGECYGSTLRDFYHYKTIPFAFDVNSLHPRKTFEVPCFFFRVHRTQGVSAAEAKSFFDLSQSHSVKPVNLHSLDVEQRRLS